jgi:hypothetical protein
MRRLWPTRGCCALEKNVYRHGGRQDYLWEEEGTKKFSLKIDLVEGVVHFLYAG